MQEVLLALGLLALVGWLGVAFGTARAWDLRPFGEDAAAQPEPGQWPRVAVIVPARNEALVLPDTIPTLLAQDYPGEWRAVLVDDRSVDATGDVAGGLGIEVVAGAALPIGWVGKVWALEQGAKHVREYDPAYYLLTDADIRHAPGSLRRLVGESEAAGLALNSRMARLRCRSGAERLLIPPFLLFFQLLYPMRRVNDRRSRVAAAAGGCVLVRRTALERAGGFAAIADRLIDDVSLAHAMKGPDRPIQLAVSRRDVESLRAHDLRGIWRMVRRTAFTQLRRSWTLLGVTLLLLVVLFALPVVLTAVGIVELLTGASPTAGALTAVAVAAWTLMTALYVPTTRYFGLPSVRALTLPVAACLYGAMTLDSGVRGRRRDW